MADAIYTYIHRLERLGKRYDIRFNGTSYVGVLESPWNVSVNAAANTIEGVLALLIQEIEAQRTEQTELCPCERYPADYPCDCGQDNSSHSVLP